MLIKIVIKTFQFHIRTVSSCIACEYMYMHFIYLKKISDNIFKKPEKWDFNDLHILDFSF